MAGAAPPNLPGFTFIESIGEGGFADVYLYEQRLPARRVAVKVLKKGADASGLEMFYAEANVMAQLSSHPSIMPIYQADVSAEGHPYLVMEFCPGPHLAKRFRTERIPVAEVLETAVKVASAVETAHRAGILHRDIKPHNILTNAYGSPLLTDFGIASSVGNEGGAEYAMSIPWSAPEVLADSPSADVRSDVFSLAASVYSLLAGRSPFEVPGAANDNATLISRIERQQPARILRGDLPDSLNTALLRALAKRPGDRPQSAMEFARALQEIEIELNRPPTRLEVLDAGGPADQQGAALNDDRTMIKPVSVIIPDQIQGTARPSVIDGSATIAQRRFQPVAGAAIGHGPALQVAESAYAPRAEHLHPGAHDQQDHRARRWAIALVGVVVVALVVFGAVSMFSGGDKPEHQAGGFEQPPADAVGQPAPAPALSAKRLPDGWRFSWVNAAPAEGDLYKVVRTRDGQALPEQRIPATSLDFKIGPGQTGCVTVTVIRKNLTQRAEASQPLCQVGQ
ncbi:Serine/threonine protein kinase [Nocardioides terrae]|uniref:non-specific serine/threonine protein kinase n=1 Tax=Nocardioides terrae TaxID=574651 RepID=A0A1I1MKE2_9ACTN|nr:serine/threonine-protein kinase [Nocardioides terrae]SFC85556.1 Serine/threonine protein kinase [Nocardioides terrae]